MLNETDAAATGLLTTAEAADVLGISRGHVAKLVRRGAVPIVRKLAGIRGHYLFDPDAIAELAQERRK